MAKYDNLASINLELLDGNLAATPAITGPVALVIATALSGKSNTSFLVDDFNKAAALFGAGSPLIKAANEVKLGGAQNVAIYRIGGVAASLKGLFGDLSEITSIEESLGIGSKYSFYIGPQPNNPSDACIIIFEGTKIVYSNVPGSEVDLGRFVIVGFDEGFAHRAGTPTAPVAFEDVIAELVDDFTTSTVGVALQDDYDLGGAGNATTLITSVTVATVPQVAGVDYNLSLGTGTAGADQVVFTVGNLPGAGDAIVVEYTRTAVVADAEFTASADNIAPTQKKLYELVDNALLELETTVATHIVIPQITLDAANLADGSVASDRLEYVIRTEEDGEPVWTWSTTKVHYAYSGLLNDATHDAVNNTTTVVGDADIDDNGQPIVAKTYSEVNFAHRFGMYIDDMAANDRIVFGAIGTSLPVASTKTAVNAWLGTSPTKDLEGVITANGTGLLGNRYMVGSTSQVAGFYKTDTGYPDGEVQYDTGGAPIDLGKFLSVVLAVINTPRSPILGLTARSINAATVYLGALTTVQAGDSTTNRTIAKVTLPFLLKKTKVNEIAGAGYVAFMDEGQAVVCASGELPTGPLSDYDYISTSITIADVTNRIRVRMRPYLGKGLGPVQLAAMQTLVDAEFGISVDAGAILKYNAQVVLQSVVNGKGRVRIPYIVVPAFELREVNQSLVLAYDI